MTLDWDQEAEGEAVIVVSIKEVFDETRNMLDMLEVDFEHEDKAVQEYALFISANFIKALIYLRDELERLEGMN